MSEINEPLYERALQKILTHGEASVRLVQRHLRLNPYEYFVDVLQRVKNHPSL